jgi:hypothetical protein
VLTSLFNQKNNMKVINKVLNPLLFSCAGLFLFSACTDLQDENFSQLVASQFTPSESDLGSIIGPAYGNWRSLMGSTNGFVRTQEISADGIVIPARPNGWVDGGIYRRMHEHKWTQQESNVSQNWTFSYGGISNCNRVIYQIESGQLPIANGKEETLAELRVLRASYYYALCDIFGNVPIITRFDVPEGFLPEQNTRKEVYDFIVKEVTEALPLLSSKKDNTTYGRFNNKWAAYALLAKVYLNAQVYTGQAAWEECIAACDAIITSNNFDLESNQADVFKTQNETSKEIVFAVPYDELFATGFNVHRETLQPNNQRTYNAEGAMFGGSCAIPQFIDTYDPEDSRLKANWIQGQQYTSSGEPLTGTMQTFNGKPLIYINSLPGVDSTQEVHGFRQGKYEYKIGLRNNLSNDVPLFRYADVLLMKAESLLRTGNATDAAALVTQVRARNFKTNPEKALVTGADLQKGSKYVYGPSRNGVINPVQGGDDIPYGRFLDELGWEFTQEGHRRQDMIRFGVYTTKSWLSHVPNGNHRVLLPIPQQELNTNPNLQQNPGY